MIIVTKTVASCKAGYGPARLSIQFKTYSQKNNQKLLKIAKMKFRKIIATFYVIKRIENHLGLPVFA